MIYIFDIDGTLADLKHRLHFIQQEPKDWDGFYADCDDDCPIADVLRLCRVLAKAGAEILLVTGRPESIRTKTVQWLNDFCVPFHGLYMRATGDHREDSVVKAELLDKLALEWDRNLIVGIFEDRNQVVEMYRSKGYRVFQVADGNF
jgi:phosphoglycolate phosphatase-like HAD superfamily hydrolase